MPVLLHYYADLSIAEVAGAMHRPEGTVKRMLYDARARLLGMIESTRAAGDRVNDLPRKRIEPLSPPTGAARPGAEPVRATAGTAGPFALLTVSVVFVAGLGGGFALGRDVPRRSSPRP